MHYGAVLNLVIICIMTIRTFNSITTGVYIEDFPERITQKKHHYSLEKIKAAEPHLNSVMNCFSIGEITINRFMNFIVVSYSNKTTAFTLLISKTATDTYR